MVDVEAVERKAALVLFAVLAACGSATPATPSTPSRPSLPSEPARPAPAPASNASADSEEEGVVIEDERSSIVVDRGATELTTDGHAVYRDAKGRLRAREIKDRAIRGDENRTLRLALGERASIGPWAIQWIGVRDGLIRLRARHRDKVVGDWGAAAGSRLATHEIATSDRLFSLEVRLDASEGRPDRSDGRIDITARTSELAVTARFGEKLSPGVFVFPDGLRVHVEQVVGCDFDPSDPCTFGGSYRAHAALGQQEAHVELKSARTTILGHTLELGRGSFVVRK